MLSGVSLCSALCGIVGGIAWGKNLLIPSHTSKAVISPGPSKYGFMSRWGLGVSEDVYCCVKTYMRDTTLQQAPVLILPADRHERLVGEPREVCDRHAMGKSKIDNCTKLEVKCRDYGLKEAVDALHALMYDRRYSMPTFPWLSRGWEVDRADRGDSGNCYFPHLPASSWRLVAGEARQKRRR